MAVNERTLTTKCIKKLRTEAITNDLPIFVSKIHAGPHQPIGLPDLVGCAWGIFFGIEMKAPGKERTLTQRQEKKLRDIKKAQGVAAVCTSWNEVWAVMKECEALAFEGE